MRISFIIYNLTRKFYEKSFFDVGYTGNCQCALLAKTDYSQWEVHGVGAYYRFTDELGLCIDRSNVSDELIQWLPELGG